MKFLSVLMLGAALVFGTTTYACGDGKTAGCSKEAKATKACCKDGAKSGKACCKDKAAKTAGKDAKAPAKKTIN
jgi:hypothetical protein